MKCSTISLVLLTVFVCAAQTSSTAEGRTDKPVRPSEKMLLHQLHSPDLHVRMRALHQLVGTPPSMTALFDPVLRRAITRLLLQETTRVRSNPEIEEDVPFEYYEDFLQEAAVVISRDYHDSAALQSLVYANYGAESPLAQRIVKLPESWPLFFAMAKGDSPFFRRQGMEMLGEVCAQNPSECPHIIPFLREKIASIDTKSREGAIMGLGTCGSEADIQFLKTAPTCNVADIDAGPRLCRQIERIIAMRLRPDLRPPKPKPGEMVPALYPPTKKVQP